jgi:hypothetical protein
MIRLQFKKMGPNEYILQCNAQPAVWLVRIRFVHDVWHEFAQIQRFLARRAVLRKMKECQFTKLAAFIRIATTCSSGHKCWGALQDTGVLSDHTVFGPCGAHVVTVSQGQVLKAGADAAKTRPRSGMLGAPGTQTEVPHIAPCTVGSQASQLPRRVVRDMRKLRLLETNA